MNNNLKSLYSLDVEADGPCAGIYSMLSFGIVSVEDPSKSFYTTIAPITDNYRISNLKSIGLTREETLLFTLVEKAMTDLKRWVDEQGEGKRKVIWSDNPAFDWQFLNYYCHAYLGDNPFGFSARRIGDFWAGFKKNPRATKDWKRLRTETHTHNTLEDARGNAGALRKIIQEVGYSPELPVLTYELGPNVSLQKVLSGRKEVAWAIRNDAQECFNKNREWEYEPSPSHRDASFLGRCRFHTAQSAFDFWRKGE